MTENTYEALTLSVNNLSHELDSIQTTLDQVFTKFEHLPEGFIERDEAKQKARIVATIGVVTVTVLLFLGGIVFGLVVYFNGQSIDSCKDSRSALKSVIEIAVADRQPLSTSTPETINAIEDQNNRTIRPLRQKLLALDGTQPEKC